MSGLTLAQLAGMLREAMDTGRWRDTELGRLASDYLEALEYAEAALTTLLAYEHVLRLFAAEHADLTLQDLEPPAGGAHVRAFLDRHWRNAAPATRNQRLAIVRSFLTWLVGEGLLRANPATNIRGPRKTATVRQAHPVAVVERLVSAQPSLRDQCALMLLGYLGLRKNELRLLQLRDVDLARSEVLIHGKGGQEGIVPLGFQALRDTLYLHLQERAGQPDEYLLYPKTHRTRPMDPASVHRWFKQALERAGLPDFPMHELRHSAAQALYEATGDPVLAQQLLRHQDLKTTRGYLHPSLDRLRHALAELDEARR